MTTFLETERLILKKPELSDLDKLTILRSDPNVMQYIGEGAAQTKGEVKDYLDSAISYFNKHGLGFFLVFEKESGLFVGEAGLFHLLFDDNQAEIEINYHLHKKFWRKGYGTQLTKALVRWGFENLSTNKIVAATYSTNIAFQKVLKKSGFDCQREKNLPDGNSILWYEIYKNDAIELEPYRKEWPEMAKIEIQKLSEILPENHIIDIQHVGSTAIPGLISKPIIDIQIAVDSLVAIKPIAIDALKALDYVYWAENPDTERMFFVKGMPPFGDKRTHHVHIVEQTSRHWKEKNLFRDYLLTHPDAVKKYIHLKKELAEKYTYDREQYTDAKTTFIREILKKAGIV